MSYCVDMRTTTQSWTIRSGADFGRAIAAIRGRRGLTQETTAELVGVPRTYLTRIETGMTVILIERILRILRRLGAEVTVSFSSDKRNGV
jgi:transcriptional regulator with XRE-family HTH domain